MKIIINNYFYSIFIFNYKKRYVISFLSSMTSIFKPELYKGKLILISGGATGICYGIAKRFLEHGASVYIISRKIDNINKAVKTLYE